MKLKSRYLFYKRCYPKYLLLFRIENKLYSYGKDEFFFILTIKEIENRQINYVLWETGKVFFKTFQNNQYLRYLKIMKLLFDKK